MGNFKKSDSSNIISMEDLRLKRFIDKNYSIREFGDKYEFCLISEYENKYDDFICDSIQFKDVFVQVLTVNGEHKLASIDFYKDNYEMTDIMKFLNLYSVKLLNSDQHQISRCKNVIEAKRFKGTAIILYEKGAEIINVNHEELIEITENFLYDAIRVNTATSKPRDSILPTSKIILNDKEIDYIPEIEISIEHDLIISNGHIMVANYIGDYCGSIGFYAEKDDDLPIAWIHDKNTTVYINEYEEDYQKFVVIDYNYALSFDDFK